MLGRRGKLAPHEDAPESGDHGGALSDGIRDRRSDKVHARGYKVKRTAKHPNDATKDASDMPANWCLSVSTHAYWLATIDRLTHEEVVERQRTYGNADYEEECGR